MIEVHFSGAAPSLEATLEAGVRAALAARGVSRAEISVAFVDDEAIRLLNRDHLGRDRPTDVIAFGLWETGDPVVVGDVYVGADQAGRQARDHGVDPDEESLRLVVHGTLHVTGMDHPEDPEERARSEMFVLQEHLVASILSDGVRAP